MPGRQLRPTSARPSTARQPPASGVAGLQRSIGNRATGQLIARKHDKKKAPAKPAYKPYELTDEQNFDWSFDRLHGWAVDRKNEGNLREAAAFYEASYWKKPSRQIASEITLCFRLMKDKNVEGATEMYQYWLDVQNNVRQPTPPPWLQHA